MSKRKSPPKPANRQPRDRQKRQPKSASQDQRDQRVRLAARLLKKGLFKYSIKEALRKKFGALSHRTIENYLRDARQLLREEYGKSVDEHKLDAYNFYRSKVASSKVADRDQIRAQERIDKLFGLEFREETDDRDLNVNINFQEVMDAVAEIVEQKKTGRRSGI